MTQILKHVDCCGFDIRKPVWVPHRNFSNIHLNSFLDYKRKLLAQHAKWGTNIGCLRRVPDRHHWMRSSVRSLRRSPSMWWWRARRNCLNTQRSSFCLNRKCYSLWPRNPKQYMIPHMLSLTAPSNSTPNSLASWRMGLFDSASAKTIKLRFASRNVIKSLGSIGVLSSKINEKWLETYPWHLEPSKWYYRRRTHHSIWFEVLGKRSRKLSCVHLF